MKLLALERFIAKRRARRRLLADNLVLARGVCEGWLTPPSAPSKGPPPRLPVAPFETIMRELDEDRADR